MSDCKYYIPQFNEVVVGLDIGTTNSACCVYDNGNYEMMVFDNGFRLLSSYVWYKKDGTIRCGKAAKLSFSRRKETVVGNSKRIIGRPYNRQEVKELSMNCGVPIVNEDGIPKFCVAKNRHVSSTEVASELVKVMLAEVNKKFPEKRISKVVITTPAYFDDNQKTATIQAGVLAGIKRENIDTLNEPSAAAICYGLSNLIDDSKVLVYDLGGGTFDVSLLHIHNGIYSVISCDGDNALGGVDFDKELMKVIEYKYKMQYGHDFIEPSMSDDLKVRYKRQLQCIAETSKIDLGELRAVSIDVTEFDHVLAERIEEGEAINNTINITQEDLNNAIRPLIMKSVDILNRVLEDTNCNRNDISKVVLVGGSSHLKLVSEILNDLFDESRLSQAVDPSECVAMGACMSIVNHVQREEIATYSLGTSLINNRVDWIIPYHAKLPAEYTVDVYTSQDYQESVVASVIQGHCRETGHVEPITDSMVRLSEYTYSGFESKKAGEVGFDTTYTMKSNGIVFVTVKDRTNGNILLEDKEIDYLE